MKTTWPPFDFDYNNLPRLITGVFGLVKIFKSFGSKGCCKQVQICFIESRIPKSPAHPFNLSFWGAGKGFMLMQ